MNLIGDILDPGPPTCNRLRVNEVNPPILGVGEQTVPYVCGQVATVEYTHPSGAKELVCAEHGEALAGAEDAERIHGWARTVEQWAREIPRRKELSHWVEQVAASFHQVARNLDPSEASE